MSGQSTGAQPNGAANGSAKPTNRSHHDGSSGRAFTDEQKAAVVRVRKCNGTAFYDILGLEAEKTTVDDNGIKKAYRKLSLLTHPDKNGYQGADEAFKMVSRAFQILSDPEKKKRYDQFGGDPDNRFSSSGSSPFAGFQRSPGGMRGAGGGMFEEEISPEELFRQFFGGGLGGGGFGGPFGGGLFDTGPGFVFNLGGGPGIRVHQFGGNRPRRRPPGSRGANGQEDAARPAGAASVLQNLLPLFLFLILPLLSSLFGSSSSSTNHPKVPRYVLDTPQPPWTAPRRSQRGVQYFVNPADVSSFSAKDWRKMDKVVEEKLLITLDNECAFEMRQQQRMYQEAQGWFFADEAKLKAARDMPKRSCQRMNSMGYYR